jgi:hypothetical protein
MAPTLQDVAGLKDLVQQLQDRITKIERSMKGEDVSMTPERIRMILMGPPGAGMLLAPHRHRTTVALAHAFILDDEMSCGASANRHACRKGNPGPEDQGEVLCLPLGIAAPPEMR